MPFDDDDDDDQKPAGKVAVKLQNKNSIFANKPRKPSKEDFERAASEANDKLNSHNDKAMELALSFKKIIEDKTLAENKNIFANEVEMEVIGSLAQLGIEMNTDENEIEGMGSIGLITLLFRCILTQRDKINSLAYNVSVLEKKTESLSKLLNTPPVDVKKDSE